MHAGSKPHTPEVHERGVREGVLARWGFTYRVGRKIQRQGNHRNKRHKPRTVGPGFRTCLYIMAKLSKSI